MTTLGTQPVRDSLQTTPAALRQFINGVLIINGEMPEGIGPADLLLAMLVLELKRSNDLSVISGDAMDENLAGLGENLDQITTRLGAIEEIWRSTYRNENET